MAAQCLTAPPPHPLTPQVTGMVETKLLDKKVAAVEEQVTKIARTELHGALPPQLARISKTTAIARTSMTGANLARTSATQIVQQVAEIEVSLFIFSAKEGEMRGRRKEGC